MALRIAADHNRPKAQSPKAAAPPPLPGPCHVPLPRLPVAAAPRPPRAPALLCAVCYLYTQNQSGSCGMGTACGPGASPAPAGPRESARDIPRMREHRWAAARAPGCSWARCGRLEFDSSSRGLCYRTPSSSSHDQQPTGGPTETPTTDAHVCASGPISHLLPGPVQPPQSQSPNYVLDRPSCDTRWDISDAVRSTGIASWQAQRQAVRRRAGARRRD
jgi:hypothetical protein